MRGALRQDQPLRRTLREEALLRARAEGGEAGVEQAEVAFRAFEKAIRRFVLARTLGMPLFFSVAMLLWVLALSVSSAPTSIYFYMVCSLLAGMMCLTSWNLALRLERFTQYEREAQHPALRAFQDVRKDCLAGRCKAFSNDRDRSLIDRLTFKPTAALILFSDHRHIRKLPLQEGHVVVREQPLIDNQPSYDVQPEVPDQFGERAEAAHDLPDASDLPEPNGSKHWMAEISPEAIRLAEPEICAQWPGRKGQQVMIAVRAAHELVAQNPQARVVEIEQRAADVITAAGLPVGLKGGESSTWISQMFRVGRSPPPYDMVRTCLKQHEKRQLSLFD